MGEVANDTRYLSSSSRTFTHGSSACLNAAAQTTHHDTRRRPAVNISSTSMAIRTHRMRTARRGRKVRSSRWGPIMLTELVEDLLLWLSARPSSAWFCSFQNCLCSGRCQFLRRPLQGRPPLVEPFLILRPGRIHVAAFVSLQGDQTKRLHPLQLPRAFAPAIERPSTSRPTRRSQVAVKAKKDKPS